MMNMFRTRLQHAEMPVRDNFWELLEQDLPVAQPTHRRRLFMQRVAAAASVMLVLAGASAAFWFLSPKDEIADAFTQVAVSSTSKGSLKNDGVLQEELPPLPAAQASGPKSHKALPTVLPTHVDEEDVMESISFSFSISLSLTEDAEQHTATNNHPSNRLAGGMEQTQRTSKKQSATEEAAPTATTETPRRGLSVGLHAAASPFATATDDAGLKHKLPISAGISVRKELSNLVSLESGLTYTLLDTDRQQKLHYLGIPLKANIALSSGKHLDVYASGGAMVEKCIAASNVSTPDALQLSLTASLGLQYNLTDRLSLYAEPTLSYHFDDGSPVNTIRKEHPLNFNLLCGVRMTY